LSAIDIVTVCLFVQFKQYILVDKSTKYLIMIKFFSLPEHS